MDVNMDGLRKRLISSYNSLTRKLNNSTKNYESFDSEIIITPDLIEKEMENIRNCLITLAFSYMDGIDGFNEMDENTVFEIFNEKE